MNEQILCPGCYLHPNFFPDQPVSQSLAAVAIVRILVAQNRMQLPSIAEAEGALAGVSGGRNVPRDAKPYIAAATRHGLVVVDATHGLQSKAVLSQTDLGAILDKAAKIQLPAPPPIK